MHTFVDLLGMTKQWFPPISHDQEDPVQGAEPHQGQDRVKTSQHLAPQEPADESWNFSIHI